MIHSAAETALIAAPFGRLFLTAQGGLLIGIDFLFGSGPERVPDNPVLEAAACQLCRYFGDPRSCFALPLQLTATEHRRRVWQALVDIPPGHTETYGSLARLLGSSARAVGAACRANPFPIVIPCHRVRSAQGVGGYCGQLSGDLLDIKRWLLRHEGCPLD